MKLDVEGGEASIFPALVESGLLCEHVDGLGIELHASTAGLPVMRAARKRLLATPGCRTRLMPLLADDETYALDLTRADAVCPLEAHESGHDCVDCLSMLWPSCLTCLHVGFNCSCLPPCASPPRDSHDAINTHGRTIKRLRENKERYAQMLARAKQRPRCTKGPRCTLAKAVKV